MAHFERVGKLLREGRIRAGLSQAEVARKFGCEQQFVSSWERGISSPPMRTLKGLAKLYDIPLQSAHEQLLADSLERVKDEIDGEFRKAR